MHKHLEKWSLRVTLFLKFLTDYFFDMPNNSDTFFDSRSLNVLASIRGGSNRESFKHGLIVSETELSVN